MHSRLLRAAKIECVEAANGLDAVETIKKSILEKEHFDAILMDSAMPVMKGPTATKLIRGLGYKGMIFGVTGNAFQADIDDFLLHGADEVLIKPLKQEEFAAIIADAAECHIALCNDDTADWVQ
jgi:CheY-like chemotaxis protein